MNDRLGDLKRRGTPSWASVDDDEETGSISSSSVRQPKHMPKHMQIFFLRVDSIEEEIDFIRGATQKIGKINEQALRVTSSRKESELSRALQKIIDEANKIAKKTKDQLLLLKEKNDALQGEKELNFVESRFTGRNEGKEELMASDMRIRENICHTLMRKFVDQMKLYQNAQLKYKSDLKKKATRQVQIVMPEATAEQVDNLMRSDGGRDALYRECVLPCHCDPANSSIETAYSNAIGKYHDVLTLEQSVSELHQMFLDFALITEQQGELLDHIEYHVTSAADFIEEGNINVDDAIRYQKKIRRKKIIRRGIIVIVVVVIVAIAVVAAM